MKPYKPSNAGKMSFVEDLIENLPIGLMILDQKGTVLRMNKKQEETSRIPREKILGKTFAETFPKTLEQGLMKHYTHLIEKGTPFNFVIDRYIPQYNPEQMTYRARGARLSSSRHFILIIGVVNFSEMLLRQMDEEDSKKEMARTIHRAGKECLKIITSVLNCFKDPHLTFTQTDIHEVLKDTIGTLKEQFGEKLNAVSMHTNFDTRIPLISGDGVQLKQSFLNILTNAVQALLPKGGQLRVRTVMNVKKSELRVFFADTGRGIPKEYLNSIFLPFFTVGGNPGRHGLGLSFAYQIIKNHDGRLDVESKEGRGTTFTAVLPLGSRA